MNSINTQKFGWILTWLLLGLAAIYIIFQGPMLGDDSFGYLGMDPFRPMGYPLFLYLMRIFGDYQNVAVMSVQIFLNIGVAYFFLKRMGSLFKLNPIYNLLLLPILLYTILFFSRPDAILTEAVTFPLFLVVCIYVIEGILTRETHFIYKAILLNTVLLLIREQFLFLYPLIGLLFIYIQFTKEINRASFKKTGYFIGAVALCLIGASTLNKAYHYVLHDTFSNPHANVSFFPTAIYISDLKDSDKFEDPAIRKAYQDLYQLIDQEGFTMNHFYTNVNTGVNIEKTRRSDLIQHYHKNFENIQNITRVYYSVNGESTSNAIENTLRRDEHIKAMTVELIKSKPALFFYINLADIFIFAFDNNRVYLLLFFLITLISFWGLLKGNRYGIILFFFISGHLLNLITSSLSIKIIPRYTFYTTFMISILFTIIMIKSLIEREDSTDNLKL